MASKIITSVFILLTLLSVSFSLRRTDKISLGHHTYDNVLGMNSKTYDDLLDSNEGQYVSLLQAKSRSGASSTQSDEQLSEVTSMVFSRN